MRMPKKMGPQAYRAMVEARRDPNSTSRWLPVLESWQRETAPEPRERRKPNALVRNPFKR